MALATLTLNHRVSAQTIDWARTTVGISLGGYDGYSLWKIPEQTILSSNSPTNDPNRRYPPDAFSLQRSVDRGVVFSIHAMHFVSYRLGFTVELAYVGNSPRTRCQVAVDGGDPELVTACAHVGSNQKFGAGTDSSGYHDASGTSQSGGTTMMQAGVVVRPFRPAYLAPFLRAGLGFTQITHSTVAVATTYASAMDSPVTLDIYNDYGWKQIHLAGAVGLGITTAPANGLAFSAEARETFIAESVIQGSTSSQGQQPPTGSKIRAIPMLLASVDLVFGRQRGKRY